VLVIPVEDQFRGRGRCCGFDGVARYVAESSTVLILQACGVLDEGFEGVVAGFEALVADVERKWNFHLDTGTLVLRLRHAERKCHKNANHRMVGNQAVEN